MWRNFTTMLCVALASAGILLGCTQKVDDQRANRTGIDGATDRQRQNLRLSLTGCLATGPGIHQFVLTHVRLAPLSVQPSDAFSAANLTIPQDSDVRLAVHDDEQLGKLVGQKVSVTGLLKHDGRNTIGTSGRAAAPDEPESRTDHSEAAATGRSHSEKVRAEAGPIGNRWLNNGTYPELTVLEVTETAQKCGK